MQLSFLMAAQSILFNCYLCIYNSRGWFSTILFLNFIYRILYMQVVYNIIIYFLGGVIRLAALFNKKARQWVKGRKNLLETIALELDHEAQHIWFHCASSGEFEQGRPVIEQFKADNPDVKIVITFFSPSGYEMRKNYPVADHVFYMPLDTAAQARKFVEYVNPLLAVFVKYEYWFNHLNALHDKMIPVVFISAIFRKNQMFFQWWGSWFRKQLKKITYFFVQDKPSQSLLYEIGVRNVVVSGDTRFDRVFEISQKPPSFPKVEKFIQGSVIFMGGSTWPADDELIVSLINHDDNDIKFILVPHEIQDTYINQLAEQIEKPVVKYSTYEEKAFIDAKVLIVDQMGILSGLYQYASMAYIGGGFGKGIHNILEAATFGMPVVFGPNYRKFAEARELISHGGAFPIRNKSELEQAYRQLLGNYELLKQSSDVSRQYVNMKRGATKTIIVFINALFNPASFKSRNMDMMNMN